MSGDDDLDQDQDIDPADDPLMFGLPVGPVDGALAGWVPQMPGERERIERPGPELFAGVAAECPPDLPDLRAVPIEELGVMEIAARAAMEEDSLKAAMLQAKSRVISLLERRKLWRYLQEKGANRVPAGWGSWESALLDIEGELAAARAYFHKVQLYAVRRAQDMRRG